MPSFGLVSRNQEETYSTKTRVDEFEHFLNSETHSLIKKHMIQSVNGEQREVVNLETFFDVIMDYNPLANWVKGGTYRFTFPRVYQVNRTTLAYIASTAFVESMFSVARRVFTFSRKRLGGEIGESLVLLNIAEFIAKRSEMLRKARLEKVEEYEALCDFDDNFGN